MWLAGLQVAAFPWSPLSLLESSPALLAWLLSDTGLVRPSASASASGPVSASAHGPHAQLGADARQGALHTLLRAAAARLCVPEHLRAKEAKDKGSIVAQREACKLLVDAPTLLLEKEWAALASAGAGGRLSGRYFSSRAALVDSTRTVLHAIGTARCAAPDLRS